MFNPFKFLWGKKEQPEQETLPRPIPAPGIHPTSDPDYFIEQLKTADRTDCLTVDAYRIAKTKKHPQCLDLSFKFKHDHLPDGSINTVATYDIAVLVLGQSGWNISIPHTTHDLDGDMPKAVIDEFICVAAADGWNCSVPSTQIVTSFIASVLATQHQNRSVESKRQLDVINVKLMMPWKHTPPKIEVRIYDSYSKVKSTMAPRLIIPFQAARKPSPGIMKDKPLAKQD